MRSIRKPALAAVAASVAVVSLAGCSNAGGSAAPTQEFVDDGTFTFSMVADPGALDPQMSAVSSLFQLSRFAYDTLVSIDLDGEIGTQLAKEWTTDGLTTTLTLNEGITCSDGSEFTAQTAADNITFVSDPANQSPFLGSYLPVGLTAEADGSELVLTLAAPAPFLLAGLANVPMVCDAGLADRSTLADSTNGTGPYVLTEATPNDHYTYEVNEDYAWGPGGATTDEDGLPATVTAKIVSNETTAANLLLSGDLNASQILGADAERLDAAGLFRQDTQALLGEQWYNHVDGHPTSDPAVRMALTQALDLEELQKVLTSGAGKAATALAVIPPTGCAYDAVTGNVPATDVDAAKAALDGAGWTEGSDGIREKDGKKLSLTFIVANTLGAGGTAASELAVAAWKEIGVEAVSKTMDSATLSEVIFSTGAWDIGWIPLNVSNPDQVVGFVSGPVAPAGANFSGIANEDYDAKMTEAMGMNGVDGCPTWAEAETALYTVADVVPFANNVVPTFGKNAEFEIVGQIEPMSIRMLG